MSSSAGSASGGQVPAPFFARPFQWLLLALVLLCVPIVGYMVDAGMPWEAMHPAINAMLNGASFILLSVGFVAIKMGNRDFHKSCMVGAFGCSSLFLISYLARYAMSGTHHYPGTGAAKAIYLFVLFSHMLLAIALVPLVLRSLFLAYKGRDEAHRKVAKWTWPIWAYVSLTGVLVYFMLYQFA